MMKKIFVLMLIVAGILVAAGVASFLFLEFSVRTPLYLTKPAERVEIPRGMGSGEIGGLLEERGIIKNRYLFYYYLWRYGRSDRLQAGTYELSGAMSIAEIVQRMIGGAVAKDEARVTIPEGYTSEEIANKLQESGFAVDIKSEMKALGITEGMLFPDTYLFDEQATGSAIVQRMHDNFLRKIETLRALIAASSRSLGDILIMASLVEEEVPASEDRAVVAGILWKRLGAGMPLQVDATVIYAKGIRGGHGDERALTSADLQIDSPYNTYKYMGLPPLPIANPGLDAVESALTPQESEYWYYLSKPDGATVFSKTLEEHNAAKLKYLQ